MPVADRQRPGSTRPRWAAPVDDLALAAQPCAGAAAAGLRPQPDGEPYRTGANGRRYGGAAMAGRGLRIPVRSAGRGAGAGKAYGPRRRGRIAANPARVHALPRCREAKIRARRRLSTRRPPALARGEDRA